jgi:hypothetical protein
MDGYSGDFGNHDSPYPQHVFSREEPRRDLLDPPQLRAKTVLERFDGFENDAADIDQDQQRQRGLKNPRRAGRRQIVI